MTIRPMSSVLRFLRLIVSRGEGGELADGQFLQAFVERGDEAAFQSLVQRHGAMVLGVCRRVLRHDQDAEDAFQATFLVLARKAGSLAWHGSLGNWLYGVAYRTAMKARVAKARRCKRDAQAATMIEQRPVSKENWGDLRPLLDQELERLPAKLRFPVVLCDLEGKTRVEAAQILGWPEGTLSWRLASARSLLARRLQRLGVTVPAAGLGLIVAQTPAAALPPKLIVATVQAACVSSLGQAVAAGLISADVAALTQGVLKAMFYRNLRFAGAVVLALAILTAGVGIIVAGGAFTNRAQGDNSGGPASATGNRDSSKKFGDSASPTAKTDSGNNPANPASPTAQGDAGKKKAEATPEKLYGDQGGEKVAPADDRLPNTVMRARHEDVFLKISNPRIGQIDIGKKKENALLVDYEVVKRGRVDGAVLVIRADSLRQVEVGVWYLAGRDNGTIQVGIPQYNGLTVSANKTFPENLEVYVARVNDRYDPPLKSMVSNTLVMGKMKTSTRPRDWTAEEIKRYGGPPPAYKDPNAHLTVGVDVPSLPAPTSVEADTGAVQVGGVGIQQFRYIDPDGRLLGLDYNAAQPPPKFPPNKIGLLVPVYSAKQPRWSRTDRLIAKDGYAVAGADVNMDSGVYGIRLLFQRVKADGKFDPKDAYESEWIGRAPATGKAATRIVNDGRRVLGINVQRGFSVERFALVVEKAK